MVLENIVLGSAHDGLDDLPVLLCVRSLDDESDDSLDLQHEPDEHLMTCFERLFAEYFVLRSLHIAFLYDARLCLHAAVLLFLLALFLISSVLCCQIF